MVRTPKAWLGSCRPGTKEATPGDQQASQQGDSLHILNHQQCLDLDDSKWRTNQAKLLSDSFVDVKVHVKEIFYLQTLELTKK
jgi:hypothetical protein